MWDLKEKVCTNIFDCSFYFLACSFAYTSSPTRLSRLHTAVHQMLILLCHHQPFGYASVFDFKHSSLKCGCIVKTVRMVICLAQCLCSVNLIILYVAVAGCLKHAQLTEAIRE